MSTNQIDDVSDRRAQLLLDYESELRYAEKLKAEGVTEVSARTAGTDHDVTIDEYVEMWRVGIRALKAGEPLAELEY